MPLAIDCSDAKVELTPPIGRKIYALISDEGRNGKYRPKIISNEKPTWHKLLLYAGTVDMLAEVMGKLTLIDFKTTATLNDMLTTVQLEAYRRALDTQDPYHPIMQTAILQLKQDGTYTWKTYKAPDLEAWQTFTALITIRAHIIKYGG